MHNLITIRIMIATFTPVVADLPLLPSRGKFNPALGQIYPRATFTPAWCIRGMSFFKFTPAIPLGFVPTSGWCIQPQVITVEPSPLKHGFQCVRALRCHQGSSPPLSYHSSHHPQEVILAQFSLYVHKFGLILH